MEEEQLYNENVEAGEEEEPDEKVEYPSSNVEMDSSEERIDNIEDQKRNESGKLDTHFLSFHINEDKNFKTLEDVSDSEMAPNEKESIVQNNEPNSERYSVSGSNNLEATSNEDNSEIIQFSTSSDERTSDSSQDKSEEKSEHLYSRIVPSNESTSKTDSNIVGNLQDSISSESSDSDTFSMRVDGKVVRLTSNISVPERRKTAIFGKLSKKFEGHITNWGKEPISVHIRLRPLSDSDVVQDFLPVYTTVDTEDGRDSLQLKIVTDIRHLPIKIGDKYRRFQEQMKQKKLQFSGICFNEMTSNAEFYERTIQQSVFEITEGIHTAVMVVGLKESGKVYSLIGTASRPGIISQAVSDLFAHIESYANLEDNALNMYYKTHPATERPLVWKALQNIVAVSKKKKHENVKRIHFLVRLGFLQISSRGLVDIAALLKKKKITSSLTSGSLEVPLNVVLNNTASPFGQIYEVEGLYWVTVTNVIQAITVIAEAFSLWKNETSAPGFTSGGDFLVFLQVERSVVLLNPPKSRRQYGGIGKTDYIAGEVTVIERTEGSMLFALCSNPEAPFFLSFAGKLSELDNVNLKKNFKEHLDAGSFFAREVILNLDEKGDVLRENRAMVIARKSVLTKILFSYFFNCGRIILLCLMNPSLDVAPQNLRLLEIAEGASKIQRELKASHSGWSYQSSYCKDIVETISHLQASRRDIIDNRATDEKTKKQIEIQISAVMSRVTAAGYASWKQLACRRLLPICKCFSFYGLIDSPRRSLTTIIKPLVVQKLEEKNGISNSKKKMKSVSESWIHPDVAKQLCLLREHQQLLEGRLDTIQKREAELQNVAKTQKRMIRDKINGRLSFPEMPEGLSPDAIPNFPKYPRLGSALSMPEIPDTNVYETAAKHQEKTTSGPNESKTLLPSSGATYSNTHLVTRPWEKTVEKLKSQDPLNSEWVQPKFKDTTINPFTLPENDYSLLPTSNNVKELQEQRKQHFKGLQRIQKENPIQHFLEHLLNPSSEHTTSSFSSSSELSSTTVDRRVRQRHGIKSKHRDTLSSSNRMKDNKRKKKLVSGDQSLKKEHKNISETDEDVSRKYKHKDLSNGKKGHVVNKKKKKSYSSSSIDSSPNKRPTIQATGALQIDTDRIIGSGPGRLSVSTETNTNPNQYGAVGLNGGYPYGGLNPYTVPHSSIPYYPVKPTLENHWAPGSFSPFAAFKYPAPPKEPKPIVVHLHQHEPRKQRGLSQNDTQNESGLEQHTTEKITSEAQAVSIATASTLRHLEEKKQRLDEENNQKVNNPIITPYPAFSPGPLGSYVEPLQHQYNLSPNTPSFPQQQSPSHIKLGFEGAVNVDPAFLSKKKREASSDSESDFKSYSRQHRHYSRHKKNRQSESSTRHNRKKHYLNYHDSTATDTSIERQEYNTHDQLRKKRKPKSRSYLLRCERRKLTKKLLQQLYFHPDAAGNVIEKTLQDLLPLLQPFERTELTQMINNYRESQGLSTLQTYNNNVSYGDNKVLQDHQDISKKKNPQSIHVPLSYLSSESTSSLEDLSSTELLEHIRDVELVDRKHQRAVLRGEAGTVKDRSKALRKNQLQNALHQLDTHDFLNHVQQDNLLAVREKLYSKNKDVKPFITEKISSQTISEKEFPAVSQLSRSSNEVSEVIHKRDDESVISGTQSDKYLKRDQVKDLIAQILNEVEEKRKSASGNFKYIEKDTFDRLQNRSSLDLPPKNEGYSSSSQLTKLIEPSSGQDYDELNTTQDLHKKARSVQNEIHSLIQNLRESDTHTFGGLTVPQKTYSSESLTTHRVTLSAKQNGVEDSSFDLIQQTSLTPPKIKVSTIGPPPPPIYRPATDIGSDTGYKRGALLDVPAAGQAPPLKRQNEVPIKMAKIPTEKPVTLDMKGTATIDGNLNILKEMGQIMGFSGNHQIGNEYRTQTDLIPCFPAELGNPQGVSQMIEDEMSDSTPRYIADIHIPLDDKTITNKLVPNVYLPPPKRQQLPPDAGSPLPLSSLAWGGAEGLSQIPDATRFPISQPHFSIVMNERQKQSEKHRFEVPVANWETVGMLAGAEDLSEGQIMWQNSLRPFLDVPWKKRVAETFSLMQQKIKSRQTNEQQQFQNDIDNQSIDSESSGLHSEDHNTVHTREAHILPESCIPLTQTISSEINHSTTDNPTYSHIKQLPLDTDVIHHKKLSSTSSLSNNIPIDILPTFRLNIEQIPETDSLPPYYNSEELQDKEESIPPLISDIHPLSQSQTVIHDTLLTTSESTPLPSISVSDSNNNVQQHFFPSMKNHFSTNAAQQISIKKSTSLPTDHQVDSTVVSNAGSPDLLSARSLPTFHSTTKMNKTVLLKRSDSQLNNQLLSTPSTIPIKEKQPSMLFKNQQTIQPKTSINGPLDTDSQKNSPTLHHSRYPLLHKKSYRVSRPSYIPSKTTLPTTQAPLLTESQLNSTVPLMSPCISSTTNKKHLDPFPHLNTILKTVTEFQPHTSFIATPITRPIVTSSLTSPISCQSTDMTPYLTKHLQALKSFETNDISQEQQLRINLKPPYHDTNDQTISFTSSVSNISTPSVSDFQTTSVLLPSNTLLPQGHITRPIMPTHHTPFRRRYSSRSTSHSPRRSVYHTKVTPLMKQTNKNRCIVEPFMSTTYLNNENEYYLCPEISQTINTCGFIARQQSPPTTVFRSKVQRKSRSWLGRRPLT